MNPCLAAVNEKLLFARLLAAQLLKSGTDHLAKALCQSVLIQLEMAYRLHLKEIGLNYQLRNAAEVKTVGDLISAMESVQKHPAEAYEMQDLESRTAGWLASMLAARERLDGCPKIGESTEKSAVNDGLISTRQYDPRTEPTEPTVQNVQDWLVRLDELIERHRQTMFEC